MCEEAVSARPSSGHRPTVTRLPLCGFNSTALALRVTRSVAADARLELVSANDVHLPSVESRFVTLVLEQRVPVLPFCTSTLEIANLDPVRV